MRRLLLACSLVLFGCPRPPEAVAPPPPPPPMPKIPPGCERALTGTFRHQDDQSFRYQLTDDGQVLHLRAYRQYGAKQEAIASPAAELELRRTPDGFRGQAQVQSKNLSGTRDCNVVFPYEITACSPDAVTLRTVREVRVTENCQPETLDLAENVLLRVPDEAPDAGATLDAGAPLPADAGAMFDAGSAALDAGSPAPLDAGSAPAEADAGATPAGDAGLPMTQGVGNDAGIPPPHP